MFSTRSIRHSFLIQLIFALASLIFIFSSLLYFYIQNSIFEEKRMVLHEYAQNIAHNESLFDAENVPPDRFFGLEVEIIHLKQAEIPIDFYESSEGKQDRKSVV